MGPLGFRGPSPPKRREQETNGGFPHAPPHAPPPCTPPHRRPNKTGDGRSRERSHAWGLSEMSLSVHTVFLEALGFAEKSTVWVVRGKGEFVYICIGTQLFSDPGKKGNAFGLRRLHVVEEAQVAGACRHLDLVENGHLMPSASCGGLCHTPHVAHWAAERCVKPRCQKAPHRRARPGSPGRNPSPWVACPCERPWATTR